MSEEEAAKEALEEALEKVFNQEFFDKLFTVAPLEPPSLPDHLLYHYCGLTALHGILTTKSLWMSNLYWMDDTSEIKHFCDVLASRIESIPDGERLEWQLELLRICQGEAAYGLPASLEPGSPNHHRPQKEEMVKAFATCFSSNGDLREQWIQYADNGHGYSLGFDVQQFDLTALRDERRPPCDLALVKVHYDESEYSEWIDRILDGAKDTLSDTYRAIGMQVDPFKLLTTLTSLYEASARIKHPSFKQEQEWRLLYSRWPRGEHLKFRVREGRHLIPYCEFPFPKNSLKEIILGPRNASQRNVDAIYMLLENCGFEKTQVSFPKTRVPLRPDY